VGASGLKVLAAVAARRVDRTARRGETNMILCLMCNFLDDY
jgi:hypothetical protein